MPPTPKRRTSRRRPREAGVAAEPGRARKTAREEPTPEERLANAQALEQLRDELRRQFH
jgi:hypothetical protein